MASPLSKFGSLAEDDASALSQREAEEKEKSADGRRSPEGSQEPLDPLDGLGWRQSKPEGMSKGELQHEMKVRGERLNSVVVWGLNTTPPEAAEDFKAEVRSKIKVTINPGPATCLPTGGLLFTLENHQQKRILMREECLRGMRGAGIVIKDDLTTRQMDVIAWLETLAAKARERGHKASIQGFQQNIWLNDVKYRWSEERRELEKMEDQARGRRGSSGRGRDQRHGSINGGKDNNED